MVAMQTAMPAILKDMFARIGAAGRRDDGAPGDGTLADAFARVLRTLEKGASPPVETGPADADAEGEEARLPLAVGGGDDGAGEPAGARPLPPFVTGRPDPAGPVGQPAVDIAPAKLVPAELVPQLPAPDDAPSLEAARRPQARSDEADRPIMPDPVRLADLDSRPAADAGAPTRAGDTAVPGDEAQLPVTAEGLREPAQPPAPPPAPPQAGVAAAEPLAALALAASPAAAVLADRPPAKGVERPPATTVRMTGPDAAPTPKPAEPATPARALAAEPPPVRAVADGGRDNPPAREADLPARQPPVRIEVVGAATFLPPAAQRSPVIELVTGPLAATLEELAALADAPDAQAAAGDRAQVSRRLEIQLHPEELGTVRINLVSRGGEVSVEIIASTRQAHELLGSHKEALAEAIRQPGTTGGEVVIRLADAQTGRDFQSGQHPAQQAPGPGGGNADGSAANRRQGEDGLRHGQPHGGAERPPEPDPAPQRQGIYL
ncbi:MAG: hypothetical protein BroJett030_01140 [Alphaproteobacteria bacterium]|nr:MAG: hypothetical protein BroJett030_01140 [Alphaproteobacteria bacterium]